MTEKIVWTEDGDGWWRGDHSQLSAPISIEYDGSFKAYFITSHPARVSYDTLRAAKIAAARMLPGIVGEQQSHYRSRKGQ